MIITFHNKFLRCLCMRRVSYLHRLYRICIPWTQRSFDKGQISLKNQNKMNTDNNYYTILFVTNICHYVFYGNNQLEFIAFLTISSLPLVRSAGSTIRARYLLLSPTFYDISCSSCTPVTSGQGVRSGDLSGQVYGLRRVGFRGSCV